MRTFLRFLKPYQGLCLLTLLVMALDVAGALYLPTIVADMINIGVAGGDLDLSLIHIWRPSTWGALSWGWGFSLGWSG